VRRGQSWRSIILSPALAVLIFFTSLYLLTGTYFTKGISDGDVMAQTAVALAQQHTVQLPANPGLPQIIPGKDSHYFSKYGIGQPLIAAGLYIIGRVFSRVTMPQAEPNVIGHFFIMLLPPLATALTVWLVYLWGKGIYGSVKIGLGLALLFGLGTNAWPYTKVFFSEPLFTLCTFGAAFALWRSKQAASPRSRYGWVGLAGFLLSYSLMTRISGVILFPAYLIYLWWDDLKEWWPLLLARFKKTDSPTLQPQPLTPIFSVLALGIGMLPGIALILLHNYVRFGNPLNNGYDGESFSTPLWVGLSGLLFSPGKSLFVYSPILLALPFAVTGFWRRAKAETVLFGLLSLITLVYYSRWWAWEGGWCWGPRFLVPLLPFLVLPLGVLLQKGRTWVIVLFIVLLPISVVVQMLGVAIDFNPYLASLANSPGKAPDVYIWSPDASP
jgi:hypothetical protein